ncbi:DUF3316 domain-containing protein [Porphyromonadaceae sp. NP-X]|jgi:hypothetical protein|nr:DUF3316 domain-containing protein [Porphyromonadaceae sp. NP-X]NLJ20273.1 DUF3316 domain-containing protein [Bacteroidales bacterium]
MLKINKTNIFPPHMIQNTSIFFTQKLLQRHKSKEFVLIKSMLVAWMMIAAFSLNAQDIILQTRTLTTSTHAFGFSTINMLDSYLSPLKYSGSGFRYENDNRKFVSPENIRLSKENHFNMNFGLTENPAQTSEMWYLGMNFSWGMHRHFYVGENLLLLAGGLWDLDFMGKTNSRNQNNPFNIDLATNLNLSGEAVYRIRTPKRMLRLGFSMQAPLVGVMFVPEQGASYYEIFELQNFSNTLHFTSLHNKLSLTENLSLDIPFNHTTLRFGFRNENLKFEANQMIFKRNDLSFHVGFIYDFYKFEGTKNRAPSSFNSTYNY